MDDLDLDQIRQKRLAEMKRQAGGSAGGPNQGAPSEDEQQDRRSQMLTNVLENDARERLNRISIVKPEKAKQVQDLILKMASSGRLQKRVSEKDLIDLLNQTSQARDQQQVIIQRRRYSDDEDEDF